MDSEAHTSCHRHPLHRRCDLPSARPSLSDKLRQPGSGTTTCLALPDSPLNLRREREFWVTHPGFEMHCKHGGLGDFGIWEGG